MGFVPTGHRPIKGRHFYQAGDNMYDYISRKQMLHLSVKTLNE
jgi:hypothetical protein